METELQLYRFKVSLRLKHPSADLSSSSEALGLEPSRFWRGGEPRTTPRGTPLEGLNGQSYWTAPLDVSACGYLEDALLHIAGHLERRATFFSSHVASGGTASLFIGLFLERFNTGFTLDPATLATISSLGLALEFDLYGSEPSEPGRLVERDAAA